MAAEQIREFLLSSELDKEPLIFTGLISDWPASQWTPTSLAQTLATKKLRFRIASKQDNAVQWETQCHYEEATIQDFLQWQQGDSSPPNPLASYSRDHYWCYADYKYMAKIFSDRPDMLKAVRWERFGFEGRDGEDTTWWLGSEGAYTVCHYDTYGCNLVAQLYGRKRWLLFPPECSDCLYPTRLPYEESSVFSRVNIRRPDPTLHPDFRNAVCYQAVLEPGQVLFVPKQWWHLVESLETSISVNTWLELESDKESRLQEAVTRLLACSLMSGTADTDWLNPTEELTSHELNMAYVQKALQLTVDHRSRTCETANLGCSEQGPSQHGFGSSQLSASTSHDRCSCGSSDCGERCTKCNVQGQSSTEGLPPDTSRLSRVARRTDEPPLKVIRKSEVSDSCGVIFTDSFDSQHLKRLMPRSIMDVVSGDFSGLSERTGHSEAKGLSEAMGLSEVTGLSETTGLSEVTGLSEATLDNEITEADIVQEILQPDVINIICAKLKKRCQMKVGCQQNH